MKKYDVGLVGLGVMGQNLARNIAGKKFSVLTFNRHPEKAAAFIEQHGSAHLNYARNFRELAEKLQTPRKIILLVKAGKAVDEVIRNLTPYLSKGDILIDGGNSYYRNSIRRQEELARKGIEFVGMGISGGEEGALNGPSLMPGGSKASWKALSPILKKIAAKDFKGGPCVTYVGEDGSGHYVKMVHNGIEYSVMQMMAEAYHALKDVYGLKAPDIAKIFSKYGKGRLKSYLFDIVVPILNKADESGKKAYLVDKILDKAGQKGTGRWIAMEALEEGVALPSITLSVFARNVSAQKEQRTQLSKLYKKTKKRPSLPLAKFTRLLEEALYAGMISSYAQGFDLISVAAKERKWKIDFAEVARIWEGGCIIRANLLHFIQRAFTKAKGKPVHLFSVSDVRTAMKQNLNSWRQVVAFGATSGIPMPCLATSLTYFEEMTTETLPANLIQGLRDFFGAHTYERNDKKGSFHTDWISH